MSSLEDVLHHFPFDEQEGFVGQDEFGGYPCQHCAASTHRDLSLSCVASDNPNVCVLCSHDKVGCHAVSITPAWSAIVR